MVGPGPRFNKLFKNEIPTVDHCLALDDDLLRGCGLSTRKTSYIKVRTSWGANIISAGQADVDKEGKSREARRNSI